MHPTDDNRQAVPSLSRLPWLVGRFVPYYARHLLWQPYRGSDRLGHARVITAHLSRRHRIALYDGVMNLMLDGYAELAGHPLRPETGQVAVKLTQLVFAFDDEYERREAAGNPLHFDGVFNSVIVQRRLQEWRALMRPFATYDEIKAFLIGFVSSHYDEYVRASRVAVPSRGFDAMMSSAKMDSGGLLAALAHVIARFHETLPPDEVLQQFATLGVAGKLADDMIDFRSDYLGGHPNLLHALVRENPREHELVIQAISKAPRMSARWWRLQCPRTFGTFMTGLADLYASLTSRQLRDACGMIWLPALFGHVGATEMRGRI